MKQTGTKKDLIDEREGLLAKLRKDNDVHSILLERIKKLQEKETKMSEKMNKNRQTVWGLNGHINHMELNNKTTYKLQREFINFE